MNNVTYYTEIVSVDNHRWMLPQVWLLEAVITINGNKAELTIPNVDPSRKITVSIKEAISILELIDVIKWERT
jgi:hypothetical protein